MLPAVRWLDEHLAAEGRSADELVQLEILSQGSANLMARNIITSMRLMSAFDWKIFFESVSLVDEVLRAGSRFGEMDFRTRDMYRHAIEELARGSRSSELQVARAALQRAQESGHVEGVRRHPRRAPEGSRLLSDFGGPSSLRAGAPLPGFPGSPDLSRIRSRGESGLRRHSHAAHRSDPRPALAPGRGAGAGALSVLLLELVLFFPASDLAVAVMNRVVTELIGPRPLAKLELRDGVPRI